MLEYIISELNYAHKLCLNILKPQKLKTSKQYLKTVTAKLKLPI